RSRLYAERVLIHLGPPPAQCSIPRSAGSQAGQLLSGLADQEERRPQLSKNSETRGLEEVMPSGKTPRNSPSRWVRSLWLARCLRVNSGIRNVGEAPHGRGRG